MPWLKLDDGLAEHPKLTRYEDDYDRCLSTFVQLCLYCAHNLTDGAIPRREETKHSSTTIALLLLPFEDGPGFLERGEDGRLIVHDYLDYNPTKAQVLAERAANALRSAMHADPALKRAIRDRDGDQCRYCGVTVRWSDRKGGKGGTYDHVLPVSRGGQNTPANLVVACRSCNSSKKARTPEEAGMPLLEPRSNLGQTTDKPVVSTMNPVPVPAPPPNPKVSTSETDVEISPLSLDGVPDEVQGYWETKAGRLATKDDLRSMRSLVKNYGAATANLAIGQAFAQGHDEWAYITSIAQKEAS